MKSKRVHLAYPENWDDLTEDGKQEAAYQMALALQAELRTIPDLAVPITNVPAGPSNLPQEPFEAKKGTDPLQSLPSPQRAS